MEQTANDILGNFVGKTVKDIDLNPGVELEIEFTDGSLITVQENMGSIEVEVDTRVKLKFDKYSD